MSIQTMRLLFALLALAANAAFLILLVLAIAGLVYLVSPGLSAPDPLGAALMTVAGISWGFYSLVGRTSGDPTEATAHNFLYAVPLVVVTSLVFVGDFEIDGLKKALESSSRGCPSAGSMTLPGGPFASACMAKSRASGVSVSSRLAVA